MYNITLIGILGLVAIAMCWSMAVVLFRVGTTGSTGRRLALLLVFEGLTLATAGFPTFALFPDTNFNEGSDILGAVFGILHWLADGALLALYPQFLAVALLTRLTRPFASKGVRIGLWVYGLGVAVVAIGFGAFMQSGTGATWLYSSMTLVFVFGFVASIDAWRKAEPGMARTRARLFTVAFGVRDVSWGVVYGASFWMEWTNTFNTDNPLFWQVKIVYALGTLIAVPLIAYGILKAHLLDIDLRVRWTIKQSAFAAAVLAITFAVSEGIEMLVASELGDMWGLLAAGIAVVLLKPLQSFAERVVSLLMPNTNNTAEYRSSRKAQVYEAAYSEALVDGGVSNKERMLLNHLRESLGLSPDEASAIELRQHS